MDILGYWQIYPRLKEMLSSLWLWIWGHTSRKLFVMAKLLNAELLWEGSFTWTTTQRLTRTCDWNLTCESFSITSLRQMAIKAQLFGTGVASVGTQQKEPSRASRLIKNRVIRFLANLALTPGELFFAKLISSVKLLASWLVFEDWSLINITADHYMSGNAVAETKFTHPSPWNIMGETHRAGANINKQLIALARNSALYLHLDR